MMLGHIWVLEEAGLVHRTVYGRDHLLSAQPQGLDEAYAWIVAYRSLWESRPAQLVEVRRER